MRNPRHRPEVIAQFAAPGHEVTVRRIPSPDDTSYQGHAECTCRWVTVDILPELSEASGRTHVRNTPPGGAS